MSALSHKRFGEQENDMTDRPTDTSVKAKPLMTPKNLSLKKTAVDTSSRKFGLPIGNVRAGNQSTVAAKPTMKGKSTKVKKDLNFAKKEKMETKAEAKEQTQVMNKDKIKVDPKFLDEIENMYPMPEELIRDTTDPITFGLFSDERLAEIGFDSDFREAFMADNKDFDFDAFL